MPRAATPSFVCELPLVLADADERRVLIRLDCARRVYNAVLGESLKRLALLRESRKFQTARRLRGRARRDAFRALDVRFRVREYDLHVYATQFGRSWLDDHLDANTIQTIASRAWQAVRQYQLGVRGRPRFKGQGQFDSVEGKSNRQGIHWRDGVVMWGDLILRARIPADDPVIAHGLTCPVKYIRIVRRKLNGRTRLFVQLVCTGQPYRKPQHPVGQGVLGIDPGPRTFGVAGADRGAQVDLATPLKRSRLAQRRLQRRIDRMRRANNPDNYLPMAVSVLAGSSVTSARTSATTSGGWPRPGAKKLRTGRRLVSLRTPCCGSATISVSKRTAIGRFRKPLGKPSDRRPRRRL